MKDFRQYMVLIIVLLVLMLSVPASAGGFSRILHFGHGGSDVLEVQRVLRDRGYYYQALNGIYGKAMEESVINFQIDRRIRIDGIVGPETLNALYTNPLAGGNYGHYDEGDIYWLARIIQAEAGGESYLGKVAVGNVILNRVVSNDFPNTVYGVIFEYYGSIPQFSPVAEGTIYNSPSQESISAARDAANGMRPVGASTYFFNPSKAAGAWIVNNKSYMSTIGGHAFYQ